MGKANAAVLPDPVSAHPITSRPCNTEGMHFSCTGVGRLKPMAVQARWIHAARPSCVQLLEDRKATLAPKATSSTSADGETAASVASVHGSGLSAGAAGVFETTKAPSFSVAVVVGRGRFLPALVVDDDDAKRETIGKSLPLDFLASLFFDGEGWLI